MTSEKASEVHAFYSGLLEAYAFLSDEQIGVAMLHEAIEQKKKGWEDFGRHIEYMRAALAGSKLSEERKNAISTRLDVQKEEYEETYYQPEAREIVGKGDREALVARRFQLANGLYYDDEKVSWKEREARGKVKNWRDIPKWLVQQIDEKLEILHSKQNPPYRSSLSSTKQARLPSRPTSAQEYKNFIHRCDELSNLINISYSTADDDAHITVYNSADPPQEVGSSGLWCPMTIGEQAHTSSLWLEFSQQERNAIRLGHARGLCRITGGSIASDSMDGELTLWQNAREEIYPALHRKFKKIEKRAYRTCQFALEQLELEKLLLIICSAGENVPYHPNFNQAFLAHLEQLASHEVDAFLVGFCKREGMGTPHGYSHLFNLINDAPREAALTSRAALDRALGWLRTARFQYSPTIDSDTASKTESANANTSNAVKRSPIQLSVADLFSSSEAISCEEIAKKAEAVWVNLRDKMHSPAHAPTTVAALFKLMDWLGMVREGASAAAWRAAFQREWNVQISEGIAKYQIKNPKSYIFKRAVVLAFEEIKTNYPAWVENSNLPSIYR